MTTIRVSLDQSTQNAPIAMQGILQGNNTLQVGEDMTDKGWTIQDGSNDDPAVTGGSAFRIGMYFEPMNNAVASADGYVELEVINILDGGYLTDNDGNPVAVRRDYKAGQITGKQLLISAVVSGGQEKIAFEIDCSFPNQIIEASANTAIYIQVIGKDVATGLAELFFQQHTFYCLILTCCRCSIHGGNAGTRPC